jgi:type VI secretion system protein ImpK
VRHDTALVARYILCCAIDEGILSTPWGIASGWAHRSLLRLFHNEANGGDRFFSLLEHAITHQHECRDLLELFYLCLSMGFEGRLHLDPRGQDKIETLRMQLFRILYSNLPRNTALSPHWQPQESSSSPPSKWPALHVVAIVATFIAVLSFIGLRFWLHISAASIADAYEHHFEIPPAGNN